jgi:hypothetical protein
VGVEAAEEVGVEEVEAVAVAVEAVAEMPEPAR